MLKSMQLDKQALEKQIAELTKQANNVDKIISPRDNNAIGRIHFDSSLDEYTAIFDAARPISLNTLKYCVKYIDKINKQYKLEKTLYK